MNTLADRTIHARYWTENWARVGWQASKRGPFHAIGSLRRFPWMLEILKANKLLRLMTETRTGPYMEANAYVIAKLVRELLGIIDGLFSRPHETVMHEDLITPEILYGMGLHPWMAEMLGIILPLIETKVMEGYIDAAENEGIPPDTCSLPKNTMGMALKGEMPRPVAIVTSNMPCDGGMMQYTLIKKRLGAPIFHLDIPHNFYDERAVDYFVGELKRLIAWLEEHTPGRMDWDRMREVCEERNRYMEYELELWDMVRNRPAPMAAEPIYLTHLMYGIATPGKKPGSDVMRHIVELAKKNLRENRGAFGDERWRVVLWNPPTLIFPDLFAWAERAYGVAMIMDMLTYHRHPYINTKTPETMLRGLAQCIMQGPMARHTRGPAENFFGDLFHLYEHFNLDMIWMAGHIGCKNTQALNGMFREKCRARGIPLLTIDYDLSDTRIVPPEGVRRQVEQFMETIMRAERLDR
ncbi:MAG: 2-hydroxyacyl-CoA dehydratase family protein [bacterium]